MDDVGGVDEVVGGVDDEAEGAEFADVVGHEDVFALIVD